MLRRTIISLELGAAYATAVELLARLGGETIRLGSPALADALLVVVATGVAWVVLGPRAADRPAPPVEPDGTQEASAGRRVTSSIARSTSSNS